MEPPGRGPWWLLYGTVGLPSIPCEDVGFFNASTSTQNWELTIDPLPKGGDLGCTGSPGRPLGHWQVGLLEPIQHTCVWYASWKIEVALFRGFRFRNPVTLMTWKISYFFNWVSHMSIQAQVFYKDMQIEGASVVCFELMSVRACCFFCSSGMCGHKILVGRFHKEKYGKCMQFLQRSFGVPSCKLPGRPCKVTFPKGSFIFQAWFFRGYVKLRECTKRTPRLKMIQTLETWGPIGGSTNCMVGRWKIVFFLFCLS